MKRLAVLVLSVLPLTACGCGTMMNAIAGPVTAREVPAGEGTEAYTVIEPYPRFYGGVAMDWHAIRDGHVLLVADLPFSFVADTVLAIPHLPSVLAEAVRAPRRPAPLSQPNNPLP